MHWETHAGCNLKGWHVVDFDLSWIIFSQNVNISDHHVTNQTKEIPLLVSTVVTKVNF